MRFRASVLKSLYEQSARHAGPLTMEPLCDKLTRQKPVRLFFAAIRAGDRQSHQPVPWRLRRFLISTLCSLIFPVVVGLALIILTQDWDKSSLFGNIAFTFFIKHMLWK